MAWIERFTCDVRSKQQTRVEGDWWIGLNECATSAGPKSGQLTLKLTPWNNALVHSSESKHLCGAGCAHTFLDRWMAGFRAGTETCADVGVSSLH
ncbi:MAG: hypothetical protein ACYCOR_14080 [Acidobacteriaceae bacterium]